MVLTHAHEPRNDETCPVDRLITGSEASAILGLSRSERYKRQRLDPTFPQPIKDGKMSRYSYRECLAYVARKLAERGVRS